MKNNKVLVCDYNLFAMNQSLYVLDYDNPTGPMSFLGTAKMEDLGTVIAQFCTQSDITRIHLIGPENAYTKKIIEDIDAHTNNAYSRKEIEIEVN